MSELTIKDGLILGTMFAVGGSACYLAGHLYSKMFQVNHKAATLAFTIAGLVLTTFEFFSYLIPIARYKDKLFNLNLLTIFSSLVVYSITIFAFKKLQLIDQKGTLAFSVVGLTALLFKLLMTNACVEWLRETELKKGKMADDF